MKSIPAVLVVAAVFAWGSGAAAAQDPSEVIYDEDVVATFQLTMSAADWDKIVNDPFGQGDLYQTATLIWQGETVTQVGVKATGKASRRVGNRKPALKIKFDEFVPNRLWKGVDMVRLDSLKLDYSALRDRLTYWAYRQAGASAPRSCNARLIVNGDLKGLYEVEEPIRKAFARYRWSGGQPVDGNLYEIDYADENGNGHPQNTDQYLWRGPSPGTYVPRYWHPETNSIGGNYQDVVDLVNVLNNVPAAQRRTQLEALINMDSFLAYLAVTTATANFDSIFSWGVLGSNTPNNHYWYHRQDTNRLEIAAWDVENAFGNEYFTTNPPSGLGSGQYRTTQNIWFGFNSTLSTSWIQGDAGASAILRSKIQQFLNGPLSAASGRVDFIATQIRSHVAADPYKPFTLGEFDAEVQNVKDWIAARITYLRSQFPSTVNNAAFVSQSVPTSMTAGQTYPVSVRMRNTGTTVWTESNYALGSQNPTDNTTWGMNRVQLAAGDSIGANQEKVFSWTVTAPAAAGAYNFQWQMRQSGIEWFGALSPNVSVTVTSTPPPPPPPPPPTANNAAFVSQSVPATMTAGQSYPVTVTMRNTGTSTWNDPDIFRLGSQNPQDNLTWGMNRVSMPAGSSIAPNQTVTYSWSVTAPSTPGTYNFQWQMRQSGVEWFGALTSNVAVNVTSTPPPPPPPPPTANNAAFVSQSVAATMTAGQSYPVTVTMRNTGTSTWNDPDIFRLGSQNPQDNMTWGMNRVSMPSGSSIAPNQTVTYSWSVTAPSTPGTYNFQWQMRQSGVEWFGPLTPNVAVNVTSTPPPPPPPTANNAAFVSQSVPATMTAGQTYPVTVTMRNTGTSTWNDPDIFRLGSQNPQDNLTWGMNRVSMPSGSSIAPNQTVTYSWSVTAPSTPGTYNFQWQMRQSGVEWFGPLTPNVAVNVTSTPPPPPGTNAAAFVSQVIPATMEAGLDYTISVTMRNSGTTTWTEAAQYRLSSRGPRDNTTWGINRVYLAPGDSIAPGASHTFTFDVTAPSTPGTYPMQWSMVQDGVDWFNDVTPSVSVLVTAPAGGPPPVIASGGDNSNGDASINDKCAGSIGGTFSWISLVAAIAAMMFAFSLRKSE